MSDRNFFSEFKRQHHLLRCLQRQAAAFGFQHILQEDTVATLLKKMLCRDESNPNRNPQ